MVDSDHVEIFTLMAADDVIMTSHL